MNAVDPVPATEETKAPKFCEKGRVDDSTKIFFKFGNGTTLELDMSELSEDVTAQLAAHGALQKIGDSYASAGGDYGFATTQAQRVIDQLKSGVFNASTRGSGGPTKEQRFIFKAMAALLDLSEEEAQDKYESLDDAGQKKIRLNAAVKLQVQKYKLAEAEAAAAAAGNDLPGLS